VGGLERLCNYGARGPLSLERLSALLDGRLTYRMKRPSPTGQTHLVMAPVAFLRRLAALVPPPRANLVRYFGVFAPNARVRPRVVPVPLPLRRSPRQLPTQRRRSLSAPGCPAAPSPGPSSSGGRSRLTSSPALAAQARAAWWPSSFAPQPPRPSSSTCGSLPGRFRSLRPPPRPSSACGECRPRSETRPAQPRPRDCSTLRRVSTPAAPFPAASSCSLRPGDPGPLPGPPPRRPG